MDNAAIIIQRWWRGKTTVIINFGHIIDRIFSLPIADHTEIKVNIFKHHYTIESLVKKFVHKNFSFCYKLNEHDPLIIEGAERKIRDLPLKKIVWKEKSYSAITIKGFFFIYEKGLEFFCNVKNTMELSRKEFEYAKDISIKQGFDQKKMDRKYLGYTRRGIIVETPSILLKKHRRMVLCSICQSKGIEWVDNFDDFTTKYGDDQSFLWNIFQCVEYIHFRSCLTIEDYLNIPLMIERLSSFPKRFILVMTKKHARQWVGTDMALGEKLIHVQAVIDSLYMKKHIQKRASFIVTNKLLSKIAEQEEWTLSDHAQKILQDLSIVSHEDELKTGIADVWKQRIGNSQKTLDMENDTHMTLDALHNMMYLGGISMMEAMKTFDLEDLNSLWRHGSLSTHSNHNHNNNDFSNTKELFEWKESLKKNEIPVITDNGIIKMTDIFCFRAYPTSDGLSCMGIVSENIKIEGPFNALPKKDITKIRQHANVKITLWSGVELFGFVIFRCVCQKCKRLVLKVIYSKGDVENDAYLKKCSKAFNRYAEIRKKYDTYCNMDYGKYDFFSDFSGYTCRRKGNMRHLMFDMGDFRNVKKIEILKTMYCGTFSIRFSNIMIKELFAEKFTIRTLGKVFFENTGMYLKHHSGKYKSTNTTLYVGRFMGSAKKFQMGSMFVDGLCKFRGSFQYLKKFGVIPYGYGVLYTTIDFKAKQLNVFWGNTIVKDNEYLHGTVFELTSKKVIVSSGTFNRNRRSNALAKIGNCEQREFTFQNESFVEERLLKGDFENNQLEKGLVIVINETVQKENNLVMYQGFVKNGLANGYGSALGCSGERYQGFFKNGKFLFGHIFTLCPSNDNMQRYKFTKEKGYHMSDELPLHFPMEIERTLMRQRVYAMYQFVMKPNVEKNGNVVEQKIVNDLTKYEVNDTFYHLAENTYFKTFNKSTEMFKGFIYRDLVFNIMHNVAMSVNDIIATYVPEYAISEEEKEFDWVVFPEQLKQIKVIDTRSEYIGSFESNKQKIYASQAPWGRLKDVPVNLKNLRLREGMKIDEDACVSIGKWKKRKFTGHVIAFDGQKTFFKNGKIYRVEESEFWIQRKEMYIRRIQSLTRGYLTRKRIPLYCKWLYKALLQKISFLSDDYFGPTNYEMCLYDSAVMLQKLFRGFEVRKKIRYELRKHWLTLNKIVVTIQKYARRFLVRRAKNIMFRPPNSPTSVLDIEQRQRWNLSDTIEKKNKRNSKENKKRIRAFHAYDLSSTRICFGVWTKTTKEPCKRCLQKKECQYIGLRETLKQQYADGFQNVLQLKKIEIKFK